jgi:4'-phosphopantetheinyl transferase EntD
MPGLTWQTLAMPVSDLAMALDSLFPAGVATILSFGAVDPSELGPAERAAAGTFVPSRLAEFRHGRDCARRALARIGVRATDIPVGSGREPLWPPGIVGSITHDGNIAAAAVGRNSDFLALGLDLESASALESGLVPKICLPSELQWIKAAAPDEGRAAKMIFGIKEAAYKALWPSLRLVLDFHDLEILLDGGESRFCVVSRSERCPADLAARIGGRYRQLGGYFVAGAALPA